MEDREEDVGKKQRERDGGQKEVETGMSLVFITPDCPRTFLWCKMYFPFLSQG